MKGLEITNWSITVSGIDELRALRRALILCLSTGAAGSCSAHVTFLLVKTDNAIIELERALGYS